MATKTTDSEARGCLMFVGLICLTLAIGVLFGAAFGWLTLGASLMALAVLSYWA